jgi:hypothetical protein
MLPILRIVPVGGVFLAILIVVLALEPPGGRLATPARGVLIEATEHPQWRQFLMRAAVRRADELNRLRELPGMPVRDAGKIAALPTGRSDSDPDDETGAISEPPSATMPLEIGETSSTELPVTTREEKPPVLKVPQRKAPNESRRKTPQRARQAKTPAKTPPGAQPNLFETIFGGQQPAAPSGPSSTSRAEQH